MHRKYGNEYQERHLKKKNRVWPVVLAALIVTVIALIAVFGQDVLQYLKAKNTQDELRDLYRESNTGSILDIFMPRAYAEETEIALADASVHEDFAELYEINPHVVGWLSAGEGIDYPVVHYDNEYYLDHDYYGRSDKNGTLFINAANKLDPWDSILLIHGHNMKNGAMFGSLDEYREYAYLCKYPIITFRTIWDAEDVYYVPIAAFDASMNPDAYGYFDIGNLRFEFDISADNDNKARSSELEAHIAEMRGVSYWNSPVEADSTDKYIILVTCSYRHDNGRMMLVCRKLRDGETQESIREQFD